jgi:hypothetical protein
MYARLLTGASMTADADELRGNRIALIGAMVYLLEFVVIVSSGTPVPVGPDKEPAAIVSVYAQHVGGTRILAGWLALVLLGRIAFAAGLRAALSQSIRQQPLMDAAVGAMVVSVTLEIAGFALAGAAAVLADRGIDASVIVALNGASGLLEGLIFTPLGVFVALASLAMLRSKLLSRWLCWFGLVSGASLAAGGVILVAAFATSGWVLALGDAGTGIGVVGFWVWMLATGVLLFRRAGQTTLA